MLRCCILVTMSILWVQIVLLNSDECWGNPCSENTRCGVELQCSNRSRVTGHTRWSGGKTSPSKCRGCGFDSHPSSMPVFCPKTQESTEFTVAYHTSLLTNKNDKCDVGQIFTLSRKMFLWLQFWSPWKSGHHLKLSFPLFDCLFLKGRCFSLYFWNLASYHFRFWRLPMFIS